MDVESATQGLYGMDVEHQLPAPSSAPPPSTAQGPDEAPQQLAVSGEVAESILVARRAVHAFLMERKAEDIVPAKSRVVIIDGNVRLRLAFRALLENGMYRQDVSFRNTLRVDSVACMLTFYRV